jgi:Skp family chaperone for outer membrane proteins
MKHTVSILALSAVLSMSFAPAHLRAQAAPAPSAADLKKEAELQKKAAKAKEEWAKAEEKIKRLEKDLEEARADAAKKRDASDRAQRDREAFRPS